MTILTALAIESNYPDNIRIEAMQSKASGRWTSVMDLMKKGECNRTLLSFDGFPFDTEQIAIERMKDQATKAIEYVKAISN
jgi:hypothetical protein